MKTKELTKSGYMHSRFIGHKYMLNLLMLVNVIKFCFEYFGNAHIESRWLVPSDLVNILCWLQIVTHINNKVLYYNLMQYKVFPGIKFG